jgi:NhaP-type Na+/H+ or K+/H+ antiporter
MVGLHVPEANLIVITVALAIIVTLSVQSTTKRWLARRLRLVESVLPPAGNVPRDHPAPAGAPAR